MNECLHVCKAWLLILRVNTAFVETSQRVAVWDCELDCQQDCELDREHLPLYSGWINFNLHEEYCDVCRTGPNKSGGRWDWAAMESWESAGASSPGFQGCDHSAWCQRGVWAVLSQDWSEFTSRYRVGPWEPSTTCWHVNLHAQVCRLCRSTSNRCCFDDTQATDTQFNKKEGRAIVHKWCLGRKQDQMICRHAWSTDAYNLQKAVVVLYLSRMPNWRHDMSWDCNLIFLNS